MQRQDVRSTPELTRFPALLGPMLLGVVFPAPDGRPFFRAEPGVDASPAPRRMRCLVDIFAWLCVWNVNVVLECGVESSRGVGK